LSGRGGNFSYVTHIIFKNTHFKASPVM